MWEKNQLLLQRQLAQCLKGASVRNYGFRDGEREENVHLSAEKTVTAVSFQPGSWVRGEACAGVHGRISPWEPVVRHQLTRPRQGAGQFSDNMSFSAGLWVSS